MEASPEKPYLGLTWKIDQRSVSQLIVEAELRRSSPLAQASVAVSEVTQGLLRGCIRLLDLLEEPENIPVLAPLVQKELLYRLLVGDQGALLYQIGSSGTTGYQVAKSVAWLKANFAAALRVEDLATAANMSPSAFHSHFRSLTSMSPLQYQKWLRLQEARRLLLAEHLDVSQAAFQVGDESPSQFSREYRRLFGTPPSQDIKVLRQGAPHHLANV